MNWQKWGDPKSFWPALNFLSGLHANVLRTWLKGKEMPLPPWPASTPSWLRESVSLTRHKPQDCSQRHLGTRGLGASVLLDRRLGWMMRSWRNSGELSYERKKITPEFSGCWLRAKRSFLEDYHLFICLCEGQSSPILFMSIIHGLLLSWCNWFWGCTSLGA